jgi:hypothetical protein
MKHFMIVIGDLKYALLCGHLDTVENLFVMANVYGAMHGIIVALEHEIQLVCYVLQQRNMRSNVMQYFDRVYVQQDGEWKTFKDRDASPTWKFR